MTERTKSEKRRKNRVVSVRMNADELGAVQTAARAVGKTVATYVRDCAFRTPTPVIDAENVTDQTLTCRQRQHKRCDGVLRRATGPHWWCACTCHPEPESRPDRADWTQAVNTFRFARQRLSGEPMGIAVKP